LTGVSLMNGGGRNAVARAAADGAPAPAGTRWIDVRAVAGLTPERGACALVGGRKAAVFRTYDDERYSVPTFRIRRVRTESGERVEVALP
jgi:hypothetical protein